MVNGYVLPSHVCHIIIHVLCLAKEVITVVLVTTDLSMVYIVAYIHYFGLLYVAWADQRHRQCCIRHTEQFLNGNVLYDGRQGEGGRTFAFPRFGELSSA